MSLDREADLIQLIDQITETEDIIVIIVIEVDLFILFAKDVKERALFEVGHTLSADQ